MYDLKNILSLQKDLRLFFSRLKKIKRKKRLAKLNRIKISSKFPSKLKKLLEQIAILSEKEREIISEINEIEKKHLALRRSKKLKRAERNLHKQNIDWLFFPEQKREKSKNKYFWWLLLLLFLLYHRKQTNNKKHAPIFG